MDLSLHFTVRGATPDPGETVKSAENGGLSSAPAELSGPMVEFTKTPFLMVIILYSPASASLSLS